MPDQNRKDVARSSYCDGSGRLQKALYEQKDKFDKYGMGMYVCVYVYVCMYIYIYVYMFHYMQSFHFQGIKRCAKQSKPSM